jgi:hypothetical protein
VIPSLLNEFGFWHHVGEACGWKHRDHIQEKELCVKMLSKIRGHFQSRLG